MCFADSYLLYFERTLPSAPETDTTVRTEIKQTDEDEIYCRFCEHGITNRRDRVRKGGSFEHIFTNPAGYVFRIGCFKKAPGCRAQEEKTNYFSWFPGFSWSIALCGRCRAHLGWFFIRSQSEGFFGLILANLRGV